MAKVIYVVANVKNAGKTTIVRHLIKQFDSICVTSIGFDGEETDTITGSPKPLVELKKGDFVLTCERFLDGSHFAIIEAIDENPLAGTVFLAQSLLPTAVMIAGATPKSIEITSAKDCFETLVVDGALDRLVHAGFIENAHIIFVIGSQQTQAQLQRSIERVLGAFKIPLAPEHVRKKFKDCDGVCGLKTNGLLEKLSPSLLNNVISNQERYEWIFVSGVLLEETVRRYRHVKFCLSNPFSFFGNPLKFDNIYTVKRLNLDRICMNLFDRPWLEKETTRIVKSFGYDPLDILSINSQEG
ncbi:MAG TPA: hypothetical protein PLP64_02545 [Pseudothermotoga sp.]|nr:hypothetical protein [Pseudothermotoga sp.]HOK83087.1 hypothetical protein [Pseudothermotoga sp.]HPP69742.1 hypothetical protein [Pseudothermotoga sp.]